MGRWKFGGRVDQKPIFSTGDKRSGTWSRRVCVCRHPAGTSRRRLLSRENQLQSALLTLHYIQVMYGLGLFLTTVPGTPTWRIVPGYTLQCMRKGMDGMTGSTVATSHYHNLRAGSGDGGEKCQRPRGNNITSPSRLRIIDECIRSLRSLSLVFLKLLGELGLVGTLRKTGIQLSSNTMTESGLSPVSR